MNSQIQRIAALPHIDADLHYLAPMAERPRNYTYEPPAGVPRSNTAHETRRVPILDLLVQMPRDAGGPATLSVQSEPSSANVLIDSAVAGRTPYQGELLAGEHVVAVEMDGRMREERKVVAREGRDASVSFALAALPF